ncbi:GvpL/GvpF family gas vesicle protein [Streptomyces antimicrobicus]|uniref:GvpL/GvpF family gas vesicle protein n=1 Tax=Streptomyces antimicrobicus TaxID=2883108 RepID=A0ABS8B3L4_9ACTN|nr:GvpL/GvpF family gas vesicle protein [Streptomyces antimicrobicus]MCB5179201.1 GvpL/GvpF family gas vesicle protein [Streptomyces antimicrobicus]
MNDPAAGPAGPVGPADPTAPARPTGPAAPAAPAGGAGTLTYVYAVAEPSPALDGVLAALTGVAGRPVTLLVPPDPGPGPGPGPVAFVVSDVDRPDWTEEALKVHFEDLDWLGDTARAHHRVIEALAARTTVLPLRLATLYEDRDRALQALRAQRADFAERLARLRAHTEYGVKVYVRPAGATAPAAAPGPASGLSPGKAYLRARRAQHHAHEDHYRQAREAGERIAAVARRCGAAHARHPVQRGPLAAPGPGEAGENVLNDAFLVPDEVADAFRAAVQEVAGALPGVRVELTGPWAPYSFAAGPTPPPPVP